VSHVEILFRISGHSTEVALKRFGMMIVYPIETLMFSLQH
jgi:hypothetical protein